MAHRYGKPALPGAYTPTEIFTAWELGADIVKVLKEYVTKALTAGYLPLAATCVTDDVYDAFLSDDRNRTFFHGHSFTANPLACAVARETLRIFATEPVVERNRGLAARMARAAAPMTASAKIPAAKPKTVLMHDITVVFLPRKRDRKCTG